MSPYISKVKFKIVKRRITIFWQDFKSTNIGLVGVAIILLFVMAAFLGPMITPYKPSDRELASSMAMPEWIRIFPQFSDLPSTSENEVNFTLAESNDSINIEFKNYDPEICNLLNKTTVKVWKAKYYGNNIEPLEINLFWNFTYTYAPPPIIIFSFRWRVTNIVDAAYNIELCLYRRGITPVEYSLWDSNFKSGSPLRSLQYRSSYVEWPKLVDLSSDVNDLIKRLTPQIGPFENQTSESLLKTMFSDKGEYGLVMHIRLKPLSTNATCEIDIIDPKFKWLGLVHGILGTDHEGADIFSQLIYGTGVSISIGLMIAVLSTTIGTLVGVASGYIGGWIDEVSMRIVDILFCLPTFPLLLTLVIMFGRNIYLIMFFIVILAWMGLARAIRSQVLSLREMSFIESAIASGASTRQILLRHIIPNVMPLAFTSMTLSIPIAVIMETSLSFLGFSDPNLMTWGRMINQAMKFGAFPKLAWWWIFSPALAITILCTGFVFISHALDQVLNPRLRRR